ncbi:MAG: phytanoyl-CoA dioxygenase family protein [Deltaproteobacteria bacterium]|jgi:ectoine hydroxylase-related dioxygenase (phytanoyl-CoA dioxygenase family)|nr:phytanoyl-CoA dioxygenase family protein [Deltaproteobacteria bacterium]
MSGSGPIDEREVTRLSEAIASDGYAVAENWIPTELVEALKTTIDGLLDELEVPRGDNAFLGHHTRRIFNLLARHEIFRAIPAHPRTLPVIERILDNECLLSSLTAIEMGPGQAAQPLHCDDASYGLARPGPARVAIAIWALTDFTADNGGTRIVPGSHRFDRRPGRDDAPETIGVEMPAGSVLFYNGSLWHGGGKNASSARRLGIVSNYCAGYLRQEECQLLALPREQVAEFEPRLRRLVGYGTYRGLIGHVDQQSPETLVDPEAETDMVWRRIGR